MTARLLQAVFKGRAALCGACCVTLRIMDARALFDAPRSGKISGIAKKLIL